MRKLLLIASIFISCLSVLPGQEQGNATFYSKKLQGRKTTDGSKYHPDSLTCAHKSYPLGTYLLVRNPENNQEVVVKVTDRGPFGKGRLIDLSYSAAKSLDIIRKGIAKVEISQLNILPEGLTFLPTPQTLLHVDQLVVVKNYLKKIFIDDQNTVNSTQNKK